MKFIIVVHQTNNGKWEHNEHPEFGVYRSSATAYRKLAQLAKSGEVAETGIGMGTVDATESKLPFTTKTDDAYPMDMKTFNEMIARNN